MSLSFGPRDDNTIRQGADDPTIEVRLLFGGGHSVALALPQGHPLLARLLAAVANNGGARSGTGEWFQLPMESGRASIAFAARGLIGMITDPALVLGEVATGETSLAAPASPAIAAAIAASAARGHRDVIRHSVVQLDGFLSEAEVSWLMALTFAAEHRFLPARLSSHRPDYRQSLMLSAPHDLWEFMTARIKGVMPDVMRRLNISGFAIGNIDCQITASVDGSYFKAHTDAGLDGPIKRQLTYVYYFNREPKAFAGGELRIYDDTLSHGKLSATDSFQVVEPRHNSIVFFQAAVMHEVMPVTVSSRQFRDARFTVNGWVERA